LQPGASAEYPVAALGMETQYGMFHRDERRIDMTQKEFKDAADYWKNKDKNGKKMGRDELVEAAAAFIRAHNTCALATGAGSFVRCTPLEYSFHDGAFWIFSEGGMKFFALEQNRNVCLAIYDAYGGFNRLGGIQVDGEAELVERFCDEYNLAAQERNISLESLKKLPTPMYLIKITPKHADILNSDFQKQGFDCRQSTEF